MIVKWIQSILSQPDNQSSAEYASAHTKIAGKKDGKEGQLLDIASESLKSSSDEYDVLIQSGFHTVKRQRLKRKVRGRVVDEIDPAFSDSDIVEEITERIVNAVETDPYFFSIFSDENSQQD